MKEKLKQRLITYAKIDTQSDENSPTTPSTEKQWDLLRLFRRGIKGNRYGRHRTG